MKKICLLFGGNTEEHAISCKSAKTIIDNINNNKYELTTVGIDTDKHWYLFEDNPEMLENNTWKEGNITLIENIPKYLKSFDKIFPIIHGIPEENGNLQALFDLFNINYIGSNQLSSIISYDKELTKIILNHYNIPQVPYITIKEPKKLKSIDIDFPVIVKPAKGGSSVGINISNNIKELNEHTAIAFKYDNKVIIEKYIKSRELECAILEDKKIHVSNIGEIISSNKFYDYEAKYQKESKLIIPANIPDELIKEIQDLSLKIFDILDCKNLARIDFLYDYNNHVLYFNEINTMPGFTNLSMYPLLFKDKNISLKKLITKLIEN